MFLSGPPGKFAFGYVFLPKDDVVPGGDELAADGIGYWRCDIAQGDRLTWSDRVYELFGLPVGGEVDRSHVVGHYSAASKAVLERLRGFSIRHECGFMLDAIMARGARGAPRMRVPSVPILSGDGVVGLHGLKSAL
jgi:hypothetical protein